MTVLFRRLTLLMERCWKLLRREESVQWPYLLSQLAFPTEPLLWLKGFPGFSVDVVVIKFVIAGRRCLLSVSSLVADGLVCDRQVPRPWAVFSSAFRPSPWRLMSVSLSLAYLLVLGGASITSATFNIDFLSKLSTTTQNFNLSDLTLWALNLASSWLNHIFAWSRQKMHILTACTAYACACGSYGSLGIRGK